jgi:hypothetical protein
MGVQVRTRSPLRLKEKSVFGLNIHVAIAAYAALFTPNRVKNLHDSLEDFFPFFIRHCQFYGGVNHVFALRQTLNPAQQQQNDQNNKDQAQPATRVVTPLPAMRPRGQCTQKQQNQDDNQNST